MRLRSLLFVPGDRPDQMSKAIKAGADGLILDLEDSVSPARKTQARRDVGAFLAHEADGLPIFVRVNPAATGLLEDDIAAIAASRAAGVVLPKAEGSDMVIALLRLMEAAHLSHGRVLPIATETPVALFHLGEYAKVADRLLGITWGAEDLTAAVGAATPREADGSFTAPFECVRALTLFAAHAAGVPAIETVYPNFRDLDGLARYAARGARDGFTAMMAIHPAQVTIINAAFTPSAAAVADARRIVAEFDRHPGAGVVSIDGAMIDAPHLKQARRLLERADAAYDAGD